jgi:catechol-2,3-dioxygenase
MYIEGKGETMTQRETPQVIGVRHVGLSARDPAALAEFYRDVLGLQIVPVDTSALGATAFLSSRPAEVPVKMALNHGVSLSFYFDDPEGHLIEVYWPTGVACRPCHGDPINLTLSEEALRRHLAELGAGAGTPITADGAEPGRS